MNDITTLTIDCDTNTVSTAVHGPARIIDYGRHAQATPRSQLIAELLAPMVRELMPLSLEQLQARLAFPRAAAAEGFPAIVTVHTPSGPTHCCERHHRMLTGLMGFLGAHTASTVPPLGAQCANCINEHKARAGQQG